MAGEEAWSGRWAAAAQLRENSDRKEEEEAGSRGGARRRYRVRGRADEWREGWIHSEGYICMGRKGKSLLWKTKGHYQHHHSHYRYHHHIIFVIIIVIIITAFQYSPGNHYYFRDWREIWLKNMVEEEVASVGCMLSALFSHPFRVGTFPSLQRLRLIERNGMGQ